MELDAAKILHERGQVDEAVAGYDGLLNADFDNTDALFYMGTALFQQGRYGLAATVLKQVIQSRPRLQGAYQNLGNCYKAVNNFRAAEEVYRLGLELGEDSQLFCCMGSLNINMGSPEKALEWYSKGLAMDPINDVIRFNMGLAYLEMGDWARGFDYYDKGFAGGNRPMRSYANLPAWDGSPGRKVIVWGEQGIGDEIMFSSILPDMIRHSEKVILDCHPRLVDTMTRSFGVETHGTRKNHHLEWLPKSDADSHVCLTTLANHFRKSDSDFPGTPYLKADPAMVAKWRKPGRLRVGISWEGGTPYTRSDLRSIHISKLRPILEQDCDFYSLQYTPNAARDVAAFEEKTGIHLKHYPGAVEVHNYDETVAFIASMDLVITVCTSAYHVAGALGVPVWCMVPWGPAWRYLTKGETSPWYGSARLFRQRREDDWSVVIQRVANELNQRVLQGTKPINA